MENWDNISLVAFGSIIGFVFAAFITFCEDICKFIDIWRKEKCK